MEKVIRNGKVAVLYSPDYGAGWYSNHNCEELMFHPKVVELVEQKRHDDITHKFIADLLDISEDDCPYLGGSGDLTIGWIDEGAVFRIHEYDGAESIVCQDEDNWLTA